MKSTDIAWAAGFFDGEGCVSVYPGSGGNYALRVGVAQKFETPLLKLEAMFGGGISYHVRKDGRGYFHWNLYGSNALRFLRTISPYLVVKQDQAEVAIDFQMRRQPNTGTKNALTAQERRDDLRDYRLLRKLKVVE